jgi:cytoskeletal protein RodZ|tara:strand:- start:256 stop:474 length:219 start_codon:yes stop_codon:yes gene_type:complete
MINRGKKIKRWQMELICVIGFVFFLLVSVWLQKTLISVLQYTGRETTSKKIQARTSEITDIKKYTFKSGMVK